MKDNFSTNSDKYARYRPSYPQELYDYLYTLIDNKTNAWDCGTGNGQVAEILSATFKNVFATDISQQQINQAIQKNNIEYSIQPAESTNFNDDLFDFVVVAQAIHWFEFDKFYAEVLRTAKNNGLLAVVGYGRIGISPELDKIISNFYFNIVGPYWDKERKYIDEDYQTIPFPFEEIDAPAFNISDEWNFEHLIGYLETWSAVKHYVADKRSNPIELIYKDLKESWGGVELRKINFAMLVRVGWIRK